MSMSTKDNKVMGAPKVHICRGKKEIYDVSLGCKGEFEKSQTKR